jgi:MurNAc alpha-1-phosphate uridylyltransferase
MIEEWDAARMDGLLLLADMHTAMGYEGAGDFVLRSDGRIGRARDHAGVPACAYPGVQIADPRMFEDSPQGAFSTNLMWDRAIAHGKLYGTLLHGVWIHVGSPQARDEAEAYLRAPTSSFVA